MLSKNATKDAARNVVFIMFITVLLLCRWPKHQPLRLLPPHGWCKWKVSEDNLPILDYNTEWNGTEWITIN